MAQDTETRGTTDLQTPTYLEGRAPGVWTRTGLECDLLTSAPQEVRLWLEHDWSLTVGSR